MIVIIDYGMGNLRSVQKAFQKVGKEAVISNNPNELRRASKAVLPGVGAFGNCMANLKERHLIEPIYKFVETGRPFLGICLGLQLLFRESEEGEARGLDIIKGRVTRFKSTPGLKVPHMGWNNIKIKNKKSKIKGILRGVPNGAYFYFVHSYYAEPDDRSTIVATTEYTKEFVSIVSKDNIYGVQFHPEKSQEMGLRILKNFGEL